MLFEPPAREHLREPALVEAASGRTLDHGEAWAAVEERAAGLRHERGKALVFCLARNDLASALAYLGALRAGHAVLLLDPGLAPALLERLVRVYEPDFVIAGGEVERRSAVSSTTEVAKLSSELALLLSTSGSTGSPKLVRLSRGNVLSNARAIASYLGLGPGERAITSLPLHYTFGLSVLHSHLVAGGAVVLTGESVLRPGFWEAVRARGCTSLAGVPTTYQMLERVGFASLAAPSLRTLTQAGGRLAPEVVLRVHEVLAARGGRLVVMYGQTEATARIAWLPPERLPAKAGSVGIAIPGGRLSVMDGERLVTAPGERGELVYEGPNVMLGYATTRADLALGDVQRGKLRTGDLGHQDADGFFYVSGRLKRFTKLFGMRVSLDEVEDVLQVHGPTAAISQGDERIVIFCEHGDAAAHAAQRAELAKLLGVHFSALVFRRVERLPVTSSGKIDRVALEAQL